MSEIAQIEPLNWAEFLSEFSMRNNNRRARFQVFKGRSAEEETIESHLEDVSLQSDEDGKTIIVTRIDRSNGKSEKIRDRITHVIGVSVQYDRDGSENVLEITDKENELILLRMESKLDGVS